jgi:hypothetical protein
VSAIKTDKRKPILLKVVDHEMRRVVENCEVCGFSLRAVLLTEIQNENFPFLSGKDQSSTTMND